MINKENSINVRLKNADEALKLFGTNDTFLRLIEANSSARIITRNEDVIISGSKEELSVIGKLFKALLSLIRKGFVLSERDVLYAYRLAKRDLAHELVGLFDIKCGSTFDGKEILPKTLGQRHYLAALEKYDMVFAIGPAGTGKTFLAVVEAVKALKTNKVKKLLLTRPAVEAGENLGFLPGDLQEKVDPYLRPLYDSLERLLGSEQLTKMKERGAIEIAPLAYMRGRTLDDAFVILDEAQNTTTDQMKMFLTRLGFGSKMVITGDVTQVDLPRGRRSGLHQSEEFLKHLEDIAFIHLGVEDVVRHMLVQKVIDAYEANSE